MARKSVKMRRNYIYLLSILVLFSVFVFAMFEYSYTGHYPEGTVGIRLKRKIYPAGTIAVSGKWVISEEQRQFNQKNNYDYRGDVGLFILERYYDDWQRYGYTDVGFYHNIEIIKHGGEIFFSIYPTYVDDNGLPAGRYRIVKPISLCDKETGNSVSEEFDTYCYFEVK